MNSNEKDGIEKVLRAVLICLVLIQILLCLGLIFIIHTEFHGGIALKWVIIWCLRYIGLSDNNLVYLAILLVVGVFAAVVISYDLVVLYHFMVCSIVSLRGAQQILIALTK